MWNKMIKCKACGVDVLKSANKCPNCGKILHKGVYIACGVIIAITIIAALAIVGNSFDKESPSSVPSNANIAMDGVSSPQSVEDKIIVDNDGVKISYTGIKLVQYLPDQADGYMLTVGLSIENASGTDIVVQAVDSSVNGVMKPAVSGAPTIVLNEKEAVAGFSFTNLKGTGIASAADTDKIEEIEFCLSIRSNDDLSELFKSDAITINP